MRAINKVSNFLDKVRDVQMKSKQTLREQKTTLSKTQEVLYQKEFKAANRAFNHSKKGV
jgi:hypothetical protein